MFAKIKFLVIVLFQLCLEFLLLQTGLSIVTRKVAFNSMPCRHGLELLQGAARFHRVIICQTIDPIVNGGFVDGL